jgi:N-acetylglutamate synthase-like GNAT family acetyltransferase
MAADAIAIAKLIDPHEVGDGLLQRHGVTIEQRIVCFRHL